MAEFSLTFQRLPPVALSRDRPWTPEREWVGLHQGAYPGFTGWAGYVYWRQLLALPSIPTAPPPSSLSPSGLGLSSEPRASPGPCSSCPDNQLCGWPEGVCLP